MCILTLGRVARYFGRDFQAHARDATNTLSRMKPRVFVYQTNALHS